MIDYRIQPEGYKPGIYDIPTEEYFSIPALNSSALKHMRKSPAHFKAAIELPRPEPSSIQQRTFDKGKAFDLYVLEGGYDTLRQAVAVEPNISRQKKEYQEWKAAAQAQKKLVLTETELQNAIAMAKKANEKKTFRKCFEAGVPHRVVVWQCPETGLWCKAEIDWITDKGVVVDLKSTADAGFWFFSRNASRLGYANQGAFYLFGLTTITGISHTEFLLAAVEVEPPFASNVFKVPHETLAEAADENRDRMQAVRNCLDTGEWPEYPDMLMDLEYGQYYDETLDMQEEANGF